jgi:hypothetical protein
MNVLILVVVIVVAFCLFTHWQFQGLDEEYIAEQRQAQRA